MEATAHTEMNDLRSMEDGERSVLRWGGLAGMLGSVLMVVTFVFVGVFVTLEESAAYLIERFPEIRAGRTVENSLFLAVVILWVPHFLALYRAMWRWSLAPALFGSVLGIMGLVVWAAQALHHVAQVPLSNLYHAPGTTPEEQATLVFLWQATMGILEAMLLAGFVLLSIGLICLGVAMLRAPAFGRVLGGAGVVLGVLGFGGASLMLVDPASTLGPVFGMFTLIIFHFVLGRKVYRLSRAL
ncbi:DUF4386 family protein [Rubrobacter aplysinae]|uniref:DUF4386 family protein n=1 Tax=Rubrobacter aplysinae TaxID=909625 RepID=UPI00064BB095|nr:DUF4386 family protein [Rubrobacter aplysinae]